MATENFSNTPADQQNNVEDQAVPNQASTDNSPALIVGDRVYHSQDDVVKKITSADEHISRIEEENKLFREKLNEMASKLESAKAVDDVMEAIKSQQSVQQEPNPAPTVNTDEIIKQAVETFKQQQEADTIAKTQTENFNSVKQVLGEAYGDKADEFVKSTANSLGLSYEGAIDIAKNSPQAFLKMFDVQQKTGTQPTQSSVGSVPKQDSPNESILKARTTKDQVALFQSRLEAKLAQLG